VRWLEAATIVGFVVPLLGCAEPPADPIIAEVGSDVVTLSEFEAYVRAAGEEDVPLVGGELKSALLEQLIEELLLLRAAKDEGIEVAPGEVEALRAQLVPMPGLERPEQVRPAESEGQSGRNLRNLTAHLTLKKLMDAKILADVAATEEEIAAYYEANRIFYKRPEAVAISQLLVEEEEEANRLHRELTADESRFEELARAHSVGPEAANGGHLGTFRRGELPASFEREVFGIKKGTLSPVVKTDFGFHIFRVDQTFPARDLPLKEVEEAIRIELLRQKSDEALALFMEDLEKRYPVRVDAEELDFPFMNRNGYDTQPRTSNQ
jgi:parvulin-like peptidyl-prolyl isomerase